MLKLALESTLGGEDFLAHTTGGVLDFWLRNGNPRIKI
jgi:hypothetical protein